jgi:hypothetical protein
LNFEDALGLSIRFGDVWRRATLPQPKLFAWGITRYIRIGLALLSSGSLNTANIWNWKAPETHHPQVEF